MHDFIVHKISAAKRNLVSYPRKAVSYLHDLLVTVSVSFLSFFLFFRRLTEVVKRAKAVPALLEWSCSSPSLAGHTENTFPC